MIVNCKQCNTKAS